MRLQYHNPHFGCGNGELSSFSPLAMTRSPLQKNNKWMNDDDDEIEGLEYDYIGMNSTHDYWGFQSSDDIAENHQV
ncbi:hypothetical protein L1987_37133 [Smallanthus sonchifolius]|uniref:Uncharacterized protein n=1 Tax=Smallanthus sonchifolius TaxID=185202 RepID=A0ACB9HGV3_9ASTR|nr:hypothetical protein L1987_37133 [Smallanthus sonchifolius]